MAQDTLTDPGLDLPLVRQGKVRNVYELDGDLLLVATDRISAFDVVFQEGIPYKGAVLTAISAHWFRMFQGEVAHHMLATGKDLPLELARRKGLAARSMRVRKGKIIPLECVARGYLAGSGWAEYKKTGKACGYSLPSGMKQAQALPEPLFTPATKAEEGHDENLSPSQAKDLVGVDMYQRLKDLTLALYGRGSAELKAKGLILADTKFEFAAQGDEIFLADEVLTPDSSRLWPADQYAQGQSPPSFDKQFVRDYLEGLDWDKKPPAPALPDKVIQGTSSRYLEALQIITGQDPKAFVGALS